jgi:hypothetical protein
MGVSARMYMNDNRNEKVGSSFGGILDAALEIASRRCETLSRLRDALERKNDPEALRIARELCGVYEPEGDRVNPRFN